MMQNVTRGVHCSDDGHLVVQPVDGRAETTVSDGIDESDQIRRYYCISWDVTTKYVAIKIDEVHSMERLIYRGLNLNKIH